MKPSIYLYQAAAKSLVIFLLASAGCGNFEKEISVPLPPYESKLVVESYLEAGAPYRLSLTESVSYLQAPASPEVQGAQVTVSYNGQREVLSYKMVEDPQSGKQYNYWLDKEVTLLPNTDYILEVKDSKGRTVTGTTRLMPVVPIKSTNVIFDEDGQAEVEVRFDEVEGVQNYYRFQVMKENQGTLIPDFSYIFDDSFESSPEITISTGNNYAKGDTVIVTLYHLEKPYYDFLQSANDAINANGNPFGQPARLRSTVQGGLGVFTILAYDRKKVIIQ